MDNEYNVNHETNEPQDVSSQNAASQDTSSQNVSSQETPSQGFNPTGSSQTFETPVQSEYHYTASELYNDSTPHYASGDGSGATSDRAGAQASAPYSFTAHGPADTQKPVRPKKQHKALKLIAAALAVILVGGASGYLGSTLGTAKSSGTYVIPQTQTGNYSNTSTSGTLSISQLVENTKNSVVEITTETVTYGTWMGQYVSQGAGSGVIISADGYIVTCNHVISDASKITVRTADGTEYSATVVGADSQTDVAVVKIDATGLTVASFGTSADLEVGDFVIAIGNPLGELGGTVTNGIISALSRDVTIDGQTMTLLQTNAAVNPGNSGGALFDENGYLVGIVNAKSSGDDVEGIGFAIPIDLVKTISEDLINQGYVSGRFTLGVSILEISDEQTAAMYRVDRTGVYVKAVQSGGNAQLAGMQAGDCIIKFAGKEIQTYDDLSAALESCTAGQQVDVTVVRSGQEYTLSVTLYETKNS